MTKETMDETGYEAALQAARAGAAEGGVPIGSSLAGAEGVIAAGHNRRVQQGDPTAHAEIDALRAAGRRSSYRDLTLYTTLAPCALCSGAIVLFKIPRVIVGEDRTFSGEIAWLRARRAGRGPSGPARRSADGALHRRAPRNLERRYCRGTSWQLTASSRPATPGNVWPPAAELSTAGSRVAEVAQQVSEIKALDCDMHHWNDLAQQCCTHRN